MFKNSIYYSLNLTGGIMATTNKNLSFPPELLEYYREKAEEDNRSFSGYIVHVLTKIMKEDSKNGTK